jgi:biofilm PGA synthesis N-glycosyltransferase PgaC
MMAEFIFWTLVAIVAYTYAVYPLILFLSPRARRSPPSMTPRNEVPSVSVVVSVYNESTVLEDKIRNLLTLDYPQEKIEFLLGSDGSTDGTATILRKAETPQVRPFIFDTRRGKAAVLNDLVANARGSIVVFSDANTFFDPQTVAMLVDNFVDPSVGAACGELVLSSGSKSVGGVGESSYWTYENFLKKLESRLHTIVGATGGVYAIRRELYRPLPVSKTVMDDFLTPMEVLKAGYSVKYEPRALAHEKSTESVRGEFRRKVRIGAANFHGISEFSSLLHPRHGFVAFALWSHKIIRWCVPFLLIGIVATTAALAADSEFYRNTLLLEGGIGVLAVIGFLADTAGVRIGVLGLPYYFVAMNAALLVGFIKFVLKSQKPTWDVIR